MGPEKEACRIVLLLRAPGVVDVAAPMKYKPLCYDILRDAKKVIEATSPELFRDDLALTRIVIVLTMSGRVDVGAPLPNRELCYTMLVDARKVIERYNNAAAPPMRAFPGAMLGR